MMVSSTATVEMESWVVHICEALIGTADVAEGGESLEDSRVGLVLSAHTTETISSNRGC